MKIHPLPLATLATLVLTACSTMTPASTPTSTRAPVASYTVAPPAWEVPAAVPMTAQEREHLQSSLQRSLEEALQSAPKRADSLVVISSITRVEPVSPALNVASALVLFLPFDKGGASVNISCQKADTGRMIGQTTIENRPNLSHMRVRFRRLGPAELAFKSIAAEFVSRLGGDLCSS